MNLEDQLKDLMPKPQPPNLDAQLQAMLEHKIKTVPGFNQKTKSAAQQLLESVLTAEQIRTLGIKFGPDAGLVTNNGERSVAYITYNGQVFGLVPSVPLGQTRQSTASTPEERLLEALFGPSPTGEPTILTDIYHMHESQGTGLGERVQEKIPEDRLYVTILETLLPYLKV